MEDPDEIEADEHWRLTLGLIDGDTDALAFLKALNLVINVWDDLIDADAPVAPQQINEAFSALLVEIPRNPFYRRWRDELQPCIDTAIADWHAANTMQASGDHEQIARAHVLRFNMLSVWIMCARIKGGLEAAVRAAHVLRTAIPVESLEDFTKELSHGHQGQGA